MVTTLIMMVALAFIAFALFQSVLFSIQMVRQLRTATRRDSKELEILNLKIASAKAEFEENSKRSENTWEGFRKFEVSRLIKENDTVTSVYLSPHDKHPIPPFKPGQYLTFNVRIPNEKKSAVRCYSLSDCYYEDHYRVSVKKCLPPRDKPEAPCGLVSSYFNENLVEGAILDVKAPGGAFHIELSDTFPVVLIGGGIGITPVFSMLHSIVQAKLDREVWFFYGVRNSSELVFGPEIVHLAETNSNIKLHRCFSDGLPKDKQGEDFEHSEHVSVELFKKVLPSNNFDFYICGPPPMMAAVVGDLDKWGVPEKRVHFEAFGPATIKKKKADAPATDAAAPSHNIKFAQSGKSVGWSSSAESLLDLAEENDISIPSGCRVGNCGTCLTAVKSGKFTYVKEPSFEAESGTCLACIAQPSGDMEIDA